MALEPRNRQEDWYKEMIDAIGEGGGSSEPIIVTISNDVASMTSTEIKTAISEGKIVYLRDGNLTMYEITTRPYEAPNAVVFTYNYLTIGNRVQINDDGSVVRGSLAAGTYSKPSGGIPESDLAQTVKDKLNKFVVTLTPTALDYSGTMDKTVAEINAAYEAGQEIWANISAQGKNLYIPLKTASTNGEDQYPSFDFCAYDIIDDLMILAFTAYTNDGTKQTYSTAIYALTPATGGVLVVTDTNGTLDKTWAEIDAADCVVIRYNDGSRDWRLTEVATGEGKGGVAVWAYMGDVIVSWESETESGYPTRGA